MLLVDDDELIRLALPALLAEFGLQAETAGDGFQALERLRTAPLPELLILDQVMPGLTGLETLERLRAFLPELPVILASGFLDDAQVTPGPHLQFLRKPFAIPDLQLAVERLLAGRSLSAQGCG